MLKLKNGLQFNLATAAGTLKYGKGYWWERYFLIPLKIIDPRPFVIVTKSLTYKETIGNLKWYKPWTCVTVLPDGGMVNCVGMTNIGIERFYEKHYDIITIKKQPTIVSISPYSAKEALSMSLTLNSMDIIGIEYNPSCPNIMYNFDKDRILEKILINSDHPVGVKIGPLEKDKANYLDSKYRNLLSWITIGNTVPWNHLYPNKDSPLKKYGFIGGISGPQLRPLNMTLMIDYYDKGGKVPIMYCGGIDSVETAKSAFTNGAKAIQIGSCFTTRPLRINTIAKEVISNQY